MMKTTAEEREALFDRAIDEAADPVTRHWRDEVAEARMTELIEAKYGLSRREAALMAHEWYGNEIARRDLTVQLMLMHDAEREEAEQHIARMMAFWHERPELANAKAPEAEAAYVQAQETAFYAVRHIFLDDGDMQMLWHDTGLAEDFQRGLRSDNPLHWRVVARALASAGIPGVTEATLAQPYSLAQKAVLDVVDDARTSAYEHLEEDEEDEAVEEIRELAQRLAQKLAGNPVPVMEYPAAKQRADLANEAARKAYLNDVVDDIVKRLEEASPDDTYDREEADREMESWLEAEEAREGKESSMKRLVQHTFLEFVHGSRLAHALKLEPDGYVAEWGAFGVGNHEAEAEGTVYEVIKE